MSDTHTPAEVLEQNKAAMGDELGVLFTKLSSELVWMHWQWAEFVELYGTSPERLDILNKTAPFFFRMIQRMFWDDALLGISRMSGPIETMRKPNLTFRRLEALVAEDIKTEIADRTATLVLKAAFADDWRNRRIAHRDLTLALDPQSKPLPPATRQAVEDWLAEAAGILDRIQSRYLRSTTSYQHGIRGNGAASLLYYLRDGLRREDERRESLDRGEYRRDLFNDDIGAI